MPSETASCLDLWAIYPELVLAGLGLLLVPVAAFTHGRGRWRYLPGGLAFTGIVAALGLTARMLDWESQTVFCNTYALDGFAHVFKLLLLSGAGIALLAILAQFRGHNQLAHAPMALLFATLGGMGLSSALDLGLIVLFLQMLSLPSYVLVTLVRTDRASNEAVLKYFIYAAAALAVMAYGLTFLYGMTGSLELGSIGAALAGDGDQVWIVLALGLILIGYAFEMTLVPFHFWAPDVYSGAPAAVSGFVSVVPKIAGFAGFLRFVLYALPDGTGGWPMLVTLLAALTMTAGNLVALRQTHLKRLLAYSSIAQAGYILIPVAVAHEVAGAMSAVGYYLAAYLLMNLAAFSVASLWERTRGTDRLASLAGMGFRQPLPALVLALALLSLAGIPPLAGFAGKVFLLEVGLEGDLTWLVLLAAANMVLALYYYVGVIAKLYLERPAPNEEPAKAGSGVLYVATFGISTLGTLILGVFPSLGLQLTDLLRRLV